MSGIEGGGEGGGKRGGEKIDVRRMLIAII